MRMSVLSLAALFTLAAAIPRAEAQAAHAAPQSALDAALQQHVSTSTADRAMVLRLLEREDVKKVAGEAGFDLRRAAIAVTVENFDPGVTPRCARQVRRASERAAKG